MLVGQGVLIIPESSGNGAAQIQGTCLDPACPARALCVLPALLRSRNSSSPFPSAAPRPWDELLGAQGRTTPAPGKGRGGFPAWRGEGEGLELRRFQIIPWKTGVWRCEGAPRTVCLSLAEPSDLRKIGNYCYFGLLFIFISLPAKAEIFVQV